MKHLFNRVLRDQFANVPSPGPSLIYPPLCGSSTVGSSVQDIGFWVVKQPFEGRKLRTGHVRIRLSQVDAGWERMIEQAKICGSMDMQWHIWDFMKGHFLSDHYCFQKGANHVLLYFSILYGQSWFLFFWPTGGYAPLAPYIRHRFNVIRQSL